eukprot:4434872-Amphidinium_carterae.2
MERSVRPIRQGRACLLGRASIREITVRKYVDDLVLYAVGDQCGSSLLHAFTQVRRELNQAGMQLNAQKTKVIVNGKAVRKSVRRSWTGRSLPALELTRATWGVTCNGRRAETRLLRFGPKACMALRSTAFLVRSFGNFAALVGPRWGKGC